MPEAAADQRGDHALVRIIRRICQRVIPIARSIPISRVRSKMDSTSVFTMPKRLTMTDSASST